MYLYIQRQLCVYIYIYIYIAVRFFQPRYYMGVGGRHALAALTLGKRPSTHCIGCQVGPRAGLDSIPGPSSP